MARKSEVRGVYSVGREKRTRRFWGLNLLRKKEEPSVTTRLPVIRDIKGTLEEAELAALREKFGTTATHAIYSLLSDAYPQLHRRVPDSMLLDALKEKEADFKGPSSDPNKNSLGQLTNGAMFNEDMMRAIQKNGDQKLARKLLKKEGSVLALLGTYQPIIWNGDKRSPVAVEIAESLPGQPIRLATQLCAYARIESKKFADIEEQMGWYEGERYKILSKARISLSGSSDTGLFKRDIALSFASMSIAGWVGSAAEELTFIQPAFAQSGENESLVRQVSVRLVQFSTGDNSVWEVGGGDLRRRYFQSLSSEQLKTAQGLAQRMLWRDYDPGELKRFGSVESFMKEFGRRWKDSEVQREIIQAASDLYEALLKEERK